MRKRELYPLIVILTFVATSFSLRIIELGGVLIGVALVIILIVYDDWLKEMGIFPRKTKKEDVDLKQALKNNIMKHGKLKNTILILQGELSPEYFENGETLRIIENASRRGVRIAVVFGPQIFAVKNFLRLAKQGKIELFQRVERDELDMNWRKYKQEGKYNHFVYVDGKWVWLEQPHAPGVCDTKGIVFCDAPVVAKACYDRFYEVAQTCKRIDNDHLVESIGRQSFVRLDKNGNIKQCPSSEITRLKEYIGD